METISSLAGHYRTWRGYRVYSVQAGSEAVGPPILLVHGFGASTDHWRKNIGPLSHRHPVWAIDLLGFGRSQKPNITYSGELWRDQLCDFICEVIGRPVVVAGNSLGGYAALVLAVDCPEWVRGLVLINGAGPFSDAAQPNLLQKFSADLIKGIFSQSWASWLLFQYFRQRSTIRRVLLQVYRDSSAVTEQLIDDIYRPSCDPGAAEVFASVFQTPQGRYVDTLLTQLQKPLLLLWGEADPWMTVGRAERFRQFYPTAQLQLIPAGHCPHDERPELVNAALSEWACVLD
ncbi:alpha/beta fold hydrolase [Gloeobacter kilaueensis]|uniref:Acetoin dehydrogenase E2 subunit dihydrolipoyllysine-residue acetyltransferase n=1 Tax=Gloeobacter kilaueensis (strain ATCC BAA-2537 / CCAP 1431/1 / ULC 316 / JS1) TaxID=1183438 RepID=U5QIG6_GLOK1|nr:alpha/beta fold hydrolase [Gloeobacter kilaueensis]AGY58726.1 acetoin dehydrogenase E2 subunit dihydrolipoyllysine-residue acetyltransferase [Gloeobacter kilaueensis JS1]